MKILVTLTFYHPHWTGLTAYAKHMAEGLVARGHQVTVVTSQHKPDLPAEEWIAGVHVIRLPYVARVSRGVLMPRFPDTIVRLIAEHDLVQIHTPLPEAPLVALLCRAIGRPLLMTHHGDVVMPAGTFNQFVERAAYTVLRTAGQLADVVTSYSRDYAENSRLLGNFSNKLECIYPPADIPEPDSAAVAAWRAELGLEDKLVIGFAGRWVEEKGFDYLLEALPLIREQYPQAHLVYAGERQVVYDNFYARCLPLVEAQSKHITFLGLIRDPHKMANFYAMCDLFVLPSRTDMMALVQVESMLCGTPVVASDIPGARVVVRETGFGQLTPPHDPTGLARTIVETLRDRDRYLPSRAVVKQIFDPNRTLDQYEQLLARMLAARAPRRGAIDAARQQARGTLQAVSAGTLLSAAPVAGPYRGAAPLANLTPSDRATLDRLLQNEADMAFSRRARTLLDYLDLHDGETVLDCGCGMGVYMMMMSRLRDLKIVGVDGDVGRLEWAEREGVDAQLSRVDIHKLPFADASFDKVLMSEVMEHLADDRAAIREVLRVLKPGGTLALSVPHANYPAQWDPINKALEALGMRPFRKPGLITGLWSNHWRLYTPAQLRDVIASAGFQIEALEEQTHYSFPFIHLIVYSIGKPLIELNLLPKRLRDSADRFRGEQNSGSLLNPINLGVRVFRWFDRRNDNLRGDEQTFVNLVVKARKPE
jgi:glycosyltransferase involved in cell wall biosynthesis/ubiquinone/menaquinone biosynthesis C-methylase UbiE